jgi:hypothetical protein
MRAALFAGMFAFALTLAGSASADDPHKGHDMPAAAKKDKAAAKADKTADKAAAKIEKTADKAATKGAEVTLSGEMMCGKCALKEGTECNDVLKVTEGGKDATYHIVKNEVAEKNHVCGGKKKATVTGVVTEKDGKKILTASDIKKG